LNERGTGRNRIFNMKKLQTEFDNNAI